MSEPNLNLLSDQFNMYHDAAKKAEEKGDAFIAKRNYMLAAEILMKMAKDSTPALKKARMERAKRLIEIADSLVVDGKPVRKINSPKKTDNANVGQNDDKKAQKEDDDEGKEWQSAEIPNIHFSDIAGLDDVKEAVMTRMIYPLKYPEKYSAYKKKTGGGLLLYGPPGTGKTMIAKAIACEAGAKFYAIKGSDIVSKWVGESEKNISSLFETARNDKLAIIFIDEMDSLIGVRGVDTHNDKRVNEFLQQIDGFVGRNPNLLLLGATNRPWDIDSAAVRSGRFSQKIYVTLPDKKARKYLFDMQLKGVPLALDVNVNKLVALTDGYSGADIEELCDRVKVKPLQQSIKTGEIVKITQKDFERVIDEVPPSVSQNDLKRFELYKKTFDRPTKIKIDDDSNDNANDSNPNDGEENDALNVKKIELNHENSQNDENSVEVILKDEVVKLMPNEKPKLEFYLSKPFENVYIQIDSHNYTCEKNIMNWISTELDVGVGDYEVKVFSDKQICKFNIKFVRGIEENEMGI